MKKIFVIQVEYPDCDFVASDEIMEVAQECIEHYMEEYFGANIMDGDYGRIKVAQSDLAAVYEGLDQYENFLGLVACMRRAQKEANELIAQVECYEEAMEHIKQAEGLEQMVDKWLEGEVL